MPLLGERAIVLGASMSGLLAARVLADYFQAVTVVERDALPDEPANRQGLPQGRPPHVLLTRGAQTLGELFPGILDELVGAGAPIWDDGEGSRLYISLGGHLMPRSDKPVLDPRANVMYQPSRPFLEQHFRRRLQGIENVTILGGNDVAELTSTMDRKRVTGVRASQAYEWPTARGAPNGNSADLVMDATGRAAHTPAFLESLGYELPVEDHIAVHTTYVSQRLRIPPGALTEMVVLIGAAPGRPSGTFLVVSWVLTACETDVVVHTRFSRVTGLVDPPARLFNPSFIFRVVSVNRRRRRRASQSQRAEVVGRAESRTPLPDMLSE